MTDEEFIIRLQEACRKYDEGHKPYPESMFQGFSVFSDIINDLGYELCDYPKGYPLEYYNNPKELWDNIKIKPYEPGKE